MSKKLRELNIIEDTQVRHGVEHALAQLPADWAEAGSHTIETE